MKKLLKIQLADIKNEMFIILSIPFLLAFMTFLTSFMHNEYVSRIFFALSLLSSFVVYGAIVLYSIIKDYRMFFGEGASFYSALPIDPKSILISRVLYYYIVSLISFLVMLTTYALILASAIVNEGKMEAFKAGFSRIWPSISEIFSTLPMSFILLIIFMIFIFSLNSTSQICFSLAYGSEKKFRKLGIAGPIITYIVSGLVSSLISLGLTFVIPLYFVLQSNAEQKNFELVIKTIPNFVHANSLAMNQGSIIGIGSILATLLITSYFLYRTYISHKSKLSVY